MMDSGFGLGDSRRESLRREVGRILASTVGGRVTVTGESQSVDLKEEAGRRNGPHIEPGRRENQVAAVQLADEVACMANSPGGGALVVGIEDSTGEVIGTELDIDWLRRQIYQKIDVAPDIVEERVAGQRVLVLFVAPAPEPVEDTGARLRWRVGDACVPVDRSEWWQYRRDQQNFDPMAQSSGLDAAAARQNALRLVSTWKEDFGDLTDLELLRRIGAVDSEGMLSEAARLMFVGNGQSVLELTVFDVPGGLVQSRTASDSSLSCLEQLDQIERQLAVLNKNSTVIDGLTHAPIPQIPHSAVREALLNAMIHRDWERSQPIEVRWFVVDNLLVVRSPGGFPGAITSSNVLSNRAPRYPALADLYRAIGLVDKQGVGVDRMYQAMIALGHRPPTIDEVGGPFVETRLHGGRPVLPVLDLMSRIVPEPRRRDYRVSIVLYLLFHKAFVTVQSLADALQEDLSAATIAVEAAAQTTVDGGALIAPLGKKAWILGRDARKVLVSKVGSRGHGDGGAMSSVVPAPYLSTDMEIMEETVDDWLSEIGDITTGDLMALTGVSRGTVKRCLDQMVDAGDLHVLGSGRSTRYRKRAS